MSSNSGSAQITKLAQNGNNYKQWRVMIDAVLLENGIYDLDNLSKKFKTMAVNAYDTDDSTRAVVKSEATAKRLIYQSIHGDHFAYLENMTGAEMLTLLDSKFSKTGENTPRMDKILKLFEWKWNDSNMIQYISMKRTLFADVNKNPPNVGNVDQLLPEEFLVAAVIMGLPDETRKICLGWSNKKLGSMQYLETKLTAGSSWNPIEINGVKDQSKKKNFERGKSGKPVRTCTHCGKNGHDNARCWELHPEMKPKRSNAVEVLAVCKAYEVNAVEQNENFLLDSGSEVHICNNEANLSDLVGVDVPLKTANGATVGVKKQGAIQLSFLPDKLEEVLCGKNWKNILSVGRLVVDYDLTVVYSKEKAVIKYKDEILTTLVRRGYLWYYEEPTSVNSVDMHKRLGHLNYNCLAKMGFKVPKEKCETCLIGEFPKKKFNKVRSFQAKEPLEDVYFDLSGKQMVASYGGNLYFLSIIDYFTKFSWVYFLKQKSDAKTSIKNWVVNVERQLGRQIKRVITDSGGEFVNGELVKFFTDLGINFRPNIPYQHEMCGIVERLNRTLMTKARKMIFGANLNIKWWCEAVFMANIYRNISHTKSINCSPYRKLYGEEFPLYDRLRVFGCKAICRIPNEKRRKLEHQAKKFIFLGLDKDYRYKLFDTVTDTMIKCRDVVFFEEEFSTDKTDNILDFLVNGETSQEVSIPMQSE